MGIYDVEPNELIEKTAEELKKIPAIKPPVWAIYVKTGTHKQRPPLREDWWYIRAASVLRKLAHYGPIGVSKLRRKYGGKKNKGYKPEHFYKGSGNILRKIFQQLEKAELVKNIKEGKYKGRELTKKGKEFLNDIANKISPQKPIKPIKPEIEKIEVKEIKKVEIGKEERNHVRKMVEKTKKFMKGDQTAEDILRET